VLLGELNITARILRVTYDLYKKMEGAESRLLGYIKTLENALNIELSCIRAERSKDKTQRPKDKTQLTEFQYDSKTKEDLERVLKPLYTN
jgi:hypothetical protein